MARTWGSAPDRSINQLVMLLAENGGFLDESNECVDPINAMAQAVELDYNERSLSSLQSQLFIFRSRFLLQQKMDIFFFGKKTMRQVYFLLSTEHA